MTTSDNNMEKQTKTESHQFNGFMWEGPLKNGIPHGEGKMTLENNDVYQGSLREGKVDGFGTLTSKNGFLYQGQYKLGLKHGYGEYTSKESTYKGSFVEGMMHGEGTYSNKKTDIYYEGQFNKNLFHGQGKLSSSNEVLFEGIFRNGKPHNANNVKEKKNQTILLICEQKNKDISAFEPLKERYKEVLFFDETSTMNSSLIKQLISNPTKGDTDRKKIKIVINEHGSEEGELNNKEFVLKSLYKTLDHIATYNQKSTKNNQIGINNIDIVMNVCYGSKIISEDKDFLRSLKTITKEGATVNISAVDGQSEASSMMVNNKNSMPTTKTDGYYVINEFRFVKQSDFNKIKPHKIKKYKTANDFMKDNYLGKNNILKKAFAIITNTILEPSKEEKEKIEKRRIRNRVLAMRSKKNDNPVPSSSDMQAFGKVIEDATIKSQKSDLTRRQLNSNPVNNQNPKSVRNSKQEPKKLGLSH